MKLSIITPTFNSEIYIQETLDSIHQQSYRNFEHLVIDGVSTDKTTDIVKSNQEVKLLSERDRGQSDAINKGFKMASGDIVAWQNADDLYCPDAFEIVVNYFQNHPEVDLVYGYYQLIDSNSQWICDVYTPAWNRWMFAHGRFCPPQPTAFWRKRVIDRVGLLDESLHYCMDVDFYSRVVNNQFQVARIPEMLGKFRIHSGSKTQNSENDTKVSKEYKHVLAKNFQYKAWDFFLFELFKVRARLTKKLKIHWLKKS